MLPVLRWRYVRPAMPEPTKPKRIQRQRRAGWRMPEGAVYVGRPTKWGNPLRSQVYNPRPATPPSTS